MTEHIDGLYKIDKFYSADILCNKKVSSGYENSKTPLFSLCVELFYKEVNSWTDSEGIRNKYFINPQLIAPINLIKWED